MPDSSFLIDATPQKRLFRSIIADYDIETSLFELIDNAIDHWISGGRARELVVELFLAADRQTISVKDNAGGVHRDDIQLLVSPGASRTVDNAELIGIFGVGGKRAGVALGERVDIRTRKGAGPTLNVVLSSDWLADDSWDIEAREVSEISEDSTEVRVTELRQGFDLGYPDKLRDAISSVYSTFIGHGVTLRVNGTAATKTSYDAWAYHPEFLPVYASFKIKPDDKTEVSVKISAGLLQDRNPQEENYGAYFYCNGRLIVAHEKSYEVGFYSGEAGVPHPDASMARVIVELQGTPEMLPWTSNKRSLNWSHPTFAQIRPQVVTLMTRYVKLSRRLKNRRDEIVAYQTGEAEVVEIEKPEVLKRVVDLPVPRGRKKAYSERVIEQNKEKMSQEPWTRGLVEAMSVVDIVRGRTKHDTKNRIALILLDSNFEIGLKEYLVNHKDHYFNDKQIAELFADRRKVIDKVKKLTSFDDNLWRKAAHYYTRRNKLIHERATVDISDRDLLDYRDVVEAILSELFGLDFTGH